MPKYKLMIARFPYGNVEDSRCVDWLIGTSIKASRDPRFELSFKRCNDTPITMTRNLVLEDAIDEGIDLLLMIDNDVAPDCELRADPTAKPFWETSVEFMLAHPGPCVVAAPYCGPPPHENVYAFQWGGLRSHHPNVDGKLEQFTREEAARMAGIQEVAALATGLMLIDMRSLRKLPRPFTYYEWEGDGPECPGCGVRKPGPQLRKGSTEDVTFTRDLSMIGVKQYCNWDAWAGHVKQTVVRKPRPWGSDMIAAKLREAVVAGQDSRDRLADIKPQSNRFDKDIEKAVREYRQSLGLPAKPLSSNHLPNVARADRERKSQVAFAAAVTLSSIDDLLPVAEEIDEGRTQATLEPPTPMPEPKTLIVQATPGFLPIAATGMARPTLPGFCVMSAPLAEKPAESRPLQIADLYGFEV